MTGLYLGLDVGGTASRWAVVDAAGVVLGRGSAAGATGHLWNPVERERFDTMAKQVGHEANLLGGFAGVHAGVTGLGLKATPEAQVLLAQALKLPTMQISCDDDMDLAFRSAFQPGEGHLISAGTGSIGLHIAADGTRVRVGGRGLLIDDGGSGTWIALTALDRLYRLIDEYGVPKDAEILAASFYEAVGGDTWEDVRSFVYGNERGVIGTLAQVVAKAATAGDAVAQQVLDHAALELARLAKALIARAGELPVAFVGGIIGLHPSIRSGLTAALAGRELLYPKIDAALTAAQMARQRAA